MTLVRPALALALIAIAAAPAAGQSPDAGTRIDIRAAPIVSFDPRRPEVTHFGALEFRGGLVLTSPAKDFGGLSGLIMSPDGARFLAVSDKARWFRGRIVYEGTRPVAIGEAETAPMLGPDGQPLARRGLFDTESLTGEDGVLYAGIERSNRILRFDYRKDGLRARGQMQEVPRAVTALPHNRGLECLATPPKGAPPAGALVAISERGLDSEGNILGFLIGGANPGGFRVRRANDYDVSDCTFLPDGDLLLLERRFSWMTGLGVRIVRIKAATLAPDALVDGPTIFEADLGYEIDNMEGIGVHRDGAGATVLTLISDDNFSVIQRTILLQFALRD